MKQRKRGIRQMFAGAMAALMMLSVVDVSGWGVMNAKAEETAEITLAENAPQYLYVGDGTTIAVIWDGKLQDDDGHGIGRTDGGENRSAAGDFRPAGTGADGHSAAVFPRPDPAASGGGDERQSGAGVEN